MISNGHTRSQLGGVIKRKVLEKCFTRSHQGKFAKKNIIKYSTDISNGVCKTASTLIRNADCT